MPMYTFKKEERLCSIKLIQGLFHNGSSFVVYPFRVVYQVVPANEGSAQVLISVSKRRFKHAVTSNRIKRLIREAYRLEKPNGLLPYVETSSKQFYFALQYIGKLEEAALPFLREKMLIVFKKLNHETDRLDR